MPMQVHPRATLKLPSGMYVSGLAFSPDGTLLASASKQVYLWDAEDGTKRSVLRGHERQVTAVLFLPDGTLVSADWHGIRFWDPGIGKQVADIPFGGWITGLTASPDGRTLLTSTAASLHIWDLASKTLVGSAVLAGDCWSIAFAPNGGRFACSSGATVELWASESFQREHVLGRHEPGVQSIGYSPDGKLLVSGSDDGSIRVWNATTRTEVARIAGAHESIVRCVCFSPDGAYLASSGADGAARLWDQTKGTELAAFAATPQHRLGKVTHPDIKRVAFSPAGPVLASGGSNPGHLQLWDISEHRD